MFDTVYRRLPWVMAAVMALTLTGGAALAQTDEEFMPAQGINADRVDGLDAIRSTGKKNKRAGNLMAFAASGYLPNNVIQKALDADKLDGIDSTAFATIAALQSSAGAVNEADNPVHWNQIQGVPLSVVNGTTLSILGPQTTIAGGAAGALIIGYPAVTNVHYELYPVTPGGAIVTIGDVIQRSADSSAIFKGVTFANASATVAVTVRVRLTAFDPDYVSPAKMKKVITAKFVDKLPKKFSP